MSGLHEAPVSTGKSTAENIDDLYKRVTSLEGAVARLTKLLPEGEVSDSVPPDVPAPGLPASSPRQSSVDDARSFIRSSYGTQLTDEEVAMMLEVRRVIL